MPSISFIIPTMGRDTLGRTLRSIERRPQDEILVEVDVPRSYRWGNDQRNAAMARAKCDYISFCDDDDWYVEGHREMQEQAILENPGKPILFQMKYPDGPVLWTDKEVRPGNVSTPQILVPNIPEMLHTWEGARNMADCIFIQKWKFPEIIWKEQIIVNLGHPNEGDRHHD